MIRRPRGLAARLPAGTAITFAGLALLLSTASPRAWATGRDFVDETIVAEGLRARETGLELGSDARIDQDDRLQGWFACAVERGLTPRWVFEAVGLGLNRGQGLEAAGWRATKLLIADASSRRSPCSLRLVNIWIPNIPSPSTPCIC